MRFVFVWILLTIAVVFSASASTLTFAEEPLPATSSEGSGAFLMGLSDAPFPDSFLDKDLQEDSDFLTVRASEEFNRFLRIAGNTPDQIGNSLDRGRQTLKSDDLSAVAAIAFVKRIERAPATTAPADLRLANEHSGLALINSRLCTVLPGQVLSLCRIPY
jgi:hypothetical protein